MPSSAALTRFDYVIDPEDPRAPTQELWERLSPEERARVLDALPTTLPPSRLQPESDVHLDAVFLTRDVLRGYYGRGGRGVYIGNNLVVYYPGERSFAPDLLAVLDVPTHDRLSWSVSEEGRGLDFAMEILFHGSRAKDLATNVARYARLGIREYFVFDLQRMTIHGFRLPSPEARSYQPILGQAGCYRSEVLDLALTLEGGRLRFLYRGAPLPQTSELLARAAAALEQVQGRAEEEAARAAELEERAAREAERAAREAERAAREAERAEELGERAERAEERADEERARRVALEQELAEARALIAKLRGEPG